MSADEIRMLALGKVPMHYKQAADGFVVLDDLVVRNALIAYAAMVERCEKRRYENMDLIDYILKGATNA